MKSLVRTEHCHRYPRGGGPIITYRHRDGRASEFWDQVNRFLAVEEEEAERSGHLKWLNAAESFSR